MDGRREVDHAAVFASTPTPCLLLDADLVIVDANEAYLDATVRDRGELVGRHLLEALERYDVPLRDPAGPRFAERWWAPVNVPVRDAQGEVALLLHRVEDLTEAYHAEARRAATEQRFRALVEHATDLIVVVGAARELEYVTPSVSRLLGHSAEALRERHWGDFAHPEDRPLALDLVARARAAPPSGSVRTRLRVVGGDGGLHWMEAQATDHSAEPTVRGVVVNLRDVTEHHEMERILHEQARQDPLTGMPNRRAFHDALAHALARAARTDRPVGVVLLDVDDFKRVNDSMGHPSGDQLLVELARRMADALRPEDTVARLGGDEFVVLAEDLQHDHDAFAVAQRVAAAATGHYDLASGLAPRVTLSIGVTTSTAGADPDILLAHADSALYEAKRRGRNRVEVFDPELRARLLRRLRVEHDLHRALARDELVLHWQPIVDARRRELVGLEALLRWQHPERGLLGPAEFLPVAEETGLMAQIGSWVLEHAVAQAAAWAHVPRTPRVFVNLAAEQLAAPTLPDEVATLALAHRVAPARIHLEVSERVLPGDVEAISEPLHVLRDRGFGVALDDFGAGNTSLAWLQQLPIDTLKLDRRFTATICEPATRAIVSALVQLAPALGVTSLAEGVETLDQLAALRGLGCDYAQGFHFSVPRPARDLAPQLAGLAAYPQGE